MKSKFLKIYTGIAVLCGLSLLSGCAEIGPVKDADSASVKPAAERIIQAGDTVELRYICRLQTGEVLLATDAPWPGEKKSIAFLSNEELRVEPGLMAMTAVKTDEPLPFSDRSLGLPNEIEMRLMRRITGMTAEGTQKIELEAQMIPPTGNAGILRLAKVRTYDKELIMSKDEFTGRTKKPAEVGQSYTVDQAFPGKVESVDDKNVFIRFQPIADVVQTPWGKAYIHEEGNVYKMDIDAHEGSLTRVGLVVGRIVKVTDKAIVIDNRHPFGYEKIVCDVTFEGIVKPGDGKEAKGRKPGVQKSCR